MSGGGVLGRVGVEERATGSTAEPVPVAPEVAVQAGGLRGGLGDRGAGHDRADRCVVVGRRGSRGGMAATAAGRLSRRRGGRGGRGGRAGLGGGAVVLVLFAHGGVFLSVNG